MAITPLNQLDVYRIVHDFDRDYFKTTQTLCKDQVDRIFVIIQVEERLHSYLPIELISKIMRRYLEICPSVVTLLMLYNTPAITPAIVVLHPLRLSSNTDYINDASKSFLVRINKMPTDGKLASYQKLMERVFKHHFKKLTLEQKLELIRRNITPWEQKSTCQKLELLGRIQAPTLWGQTKLKLLFLSWKVQLAAAGVLEHHVIATVGSMGSLLLFLTLLAYKSNVLFLLFLILVNFSNVMSTAYLNFGTALINFFVASENFLSQSISRAMTNLEITTFINAHLPELINQWLNLTMPNDTDTGSSQMLQ